MKNKRLEALASGLDTEEMTAEPVRPWQIMATGKNLSSLDRATFSRLARLFDLMPAMPSLTIETTQGSVMVSRDFPSGMTDDIDQLLEAVYDNNPHIAAITFPEGPARSARRTTADHPRAFDLDTNGPKQDT